MTDYAAVTQEDWDNAQAALKAVLPLVESHIPPLSTQGTAIELWRLVRKGMRLNSDDNALAYMRRVSNARAIHD